MSMSKFNTKAFMAAYYTDVNAIKDEDDELDTAHRADEDRRSLEQQNTHEVKRDKV